MPKESDVFGASGTNWNNAAQTTTGSTTNTVAPSAGGPFGVKSNDSVGGRGGGWSAAQSSQFVAGGSGSTNGWSSGGYGSVEAGSTSAGVIANQGGTAASAAAFGGTGTSGAGTGGAGTGGAGKGGAAAGGAGTGGVATGGASTGTPDVNLGLLAHFAFDEKTGTVAANQSNPAQNGTYRGSCTHPSGQIGNAVTIRNADAQQPDWIEVPAGVLSGLSATTISIWVRDLSTARGGGRLFDFAAGTAEEIYFSPDQVNPTSSTSASHLSGTHHGVVFVDLWTKRASITTGMGSVWHHVAVTWSAARIELYIDGAVEATQVSPNVLPCDLGVTTTNWLGRSLNDANLALYASIDDLRIYDRALSAAEVGLLYALR